MIAHGDELGRTQNGNNNVYCQDNELAWVDWKRAREHEVLLDFTARLTALRAAHPIFRRQRFFQGRPLRGVGIDDIAWLRPDGGHMSDEDWNGGHPLLAIYLNGRGIPDRDELGGVIIDDSFLLMINTHHDEHTLVVPDEAYGRAWEVAVDTTDPLLAQSPRHPLAPGSRLQLQPRSMLVLQCRNDRRR
jgi:isoamylase